MKAEKDWIDRTDNAQNWKDMSLEQHARVFLRVMPVLNRWGESHEKVVRTTIMNTIVPSLGHMKVSAVDERIVAAFKNEIEKKTGSKGERLSKHRVTNIVRFLRQLLSAGEVHGHTEQSARAAAPNATRLEQDKQHWLASFEAFREYWSQRTTDQIPDAHPLQQWVARQRKQARNGCMPEWKRDKLSAIGFPFREHAKNIEPHSGIVVDQFQTTGRTQMKVGKTQTLTAIDHANWLAAKAQDLGRKGRCIAVEIAGETPLPLKSVEVGKNIALITYGLSGGASDDEYMTHIHTSKLASLVQQLAARQESASVLDMDMEQVTLRPLPVDRNTAVVPVQVGPLQRPSFWGV